MENKYIHFGEEIDANKYYKNMTINNFVDRTKETRLNDIIKKKAILYYKASIEYFKKLNKLEFNQALNKLLDLYTFKEVKNLKEVAKKNGIYLLVLDNYKQIYIGQTCDDLRKRILRHFKRKLSFAEVPIVRPYTPPIDAFKPLDITRIYVLYTPIQNVLDDIEANLIHNIDNKFILNKTIGGKAYDDLEVAIRLTLGRINKDIGLKSIDDKSMDELLKDIKL